ncbi:putative signal transduction histidine-protein kinase [Podospora fimiseda]|uniref:histidine kinase n=1 Tax=Podospora fimiseda TaxID=252190 RepID=A0AAN7BWF8_9PEZI|nr:putative signal transduction histidine-protein kinase [Podospora fimiseda]
MRVAIREQLATLVVFAVLVALAIVSLPTWIHVNDFVIGVESSGLTLTASLKAARISSEINLIQTTCLTISTRLMLQTSFEEFYKSNDTSSFVTAKDDLLSALSSAGFSGLLQARLYSRNTTGDPKGLLSVTGNSVKDAPIQLPWTGLDGLPVMMGDTEEGYPPMLFPNLTYRDLNKTNSWINTTNSFAAVPFPNVSIGNGSNGSGILMGPLVVNQSYALLSITIPVRKNDLPGFILGYMTVVANAKTLIDVRNSDEGLGKTGVVLFVGPTNRWNHFDKPPAINKTYEPDPDEFKKHDVRFLLPPVVPVGARDRHSEHSYASRTFDDPFPVTKLPIAQRVFTERSEHPNNADSDLTSTNEQGWSVAVGAARPQTSLVSWAIVIEQDAREAFEPIRQLRTILVACVFGTLGLVLLLVFPCAHLSVMPILRLKAATEKSIAPPGYESDDSDTDVVDEENPTSSGGTTSGRSSEKTFFQKVRRRIRKRRKAKLREGISNEPSRRQFKIPARVDDRKHIVTDELTELTQTFNEMTEELLKQYTSLDEKVAERTRELEISKKAAEAANESKTLFIANISHELKTPLNGIMGMCAVCMEEDDIVRIKQSLKTLYKSGDLLLHLLEDLLSFSKNQIGQQVSLEEREFRLGDVRSQMLAIFDKQVRENRINFNVSFVGTEYLDASVSLERNSIDLRRLPALGPAGAGRLKDMCLWGDQHRILQVLINLVSNSLKFTPPGGKVDLRIRCLGEVEQTLVGENSRSSSFSKAGSGRQGRTRHRMGSESTHSGSSKGQSPASPPVPPTGTALSINPVERKITPHIQFRERSPTPPPANAKSFLFEFEVEDTGPGIAPNMQQKIFEPFVQGDLGLSKKYGGTGLGLSICSQLATIMGGNISLRSTVGVGTTFTMQIPLKYVKDRTSSTASSSIKSRPTSVASMDNPDKRNSFTIPRSGSDPPPPPPPPPTVLDKQPRLVGLSQPFFATNPNPHPTKEDQLAAIESAMANKPSGQGRLRVLVAEDNPTNIEVVSRMLKLEEIYDVTIAKDGQEAYDFVKAAMENNQYFDVIFMDIQMPNLDGLQSTRLIRKMGYSAPIVALTAFSEESNVKECMESGMDEFLSKPIRRPALKQVLKKFATIEEEPETSSLATKRTTPNATPAQTPAKEVTDPMGNHGMNGGGYSSKG